MAYLDKRFLEKIQHPVNTVLELGSRDLKDGIELLKVFPAHVYSFECNPDCLALCEANYATLDSASASRLTLVPCAVSTTDGPVSFFSFDRAQYDNVGASSMLKIDFTKRHTSDPDYGRPNPQVEVTVQGVRMDTFCTRMGLKSVDLVCMDLQGYELEALKSFGSALSNVRYVILETASKSTYTGGACFTDVKAFLESAGFGFVGHDAGFKDIATYLDSVLDGRSVETLVDKSWALAHAGFSEFNCIFENKRFTEPATTLATTPTPSLLTELNAVRAQLAGAQKALDRIAGELETRGAQ
jgi:FkbM family methyltransferase